MGVDELVAVLERLGDRDPALIVCVGLAEVAELAMRETDRVEAERDLAQEAEVLGDRQGVLRRREGRLPLRVRRLRGEARPERPRGEQEHAEPGALVADDRQATLDDRVEVGMLRVPAGAELGDVREHGRDILAPRIALLKDGEGALVGEEGRVVLAAVAADAGDEVERLHRIVGPILLLVELERLLRETKSLDVGVDRRRALRSAPGVIGSLLGHVAEKEVVREGGKEVLHPLAHDRLERRGDAAMQLDAPANEERVVGDLLYHGVLEAIPALAALARRPLEHEVGADELVHGVRDPTAAGLAKDAIAEALPDHRRELDALLRDRRQPVDARGNDRVQRCGYL